MVVIGWPWDGKYTKDECRATFEQVLVLLNTLNLSIVFNPELILSISLNYVW